MDIFVRNIPEIAESFCLLEQVISSSFDSPSPNDVERTLFALPVYLGGLGIFIPCENAPAFWKDSWSYHFIHFATIFSFLSACFGSAAGNLS